MTAVLVLSSPQTQDRLTPIIGMLSDSISLRLQNRLPEALACLDAILEQVPTFAPCLLDRAKVLALLQRFEDALADCRAYFRHGPAAPELLQLRDNIRDAALDHCQQALAANPDDVEQLFRRANVHLQCDNYPLAVQEYGLALAVDPQHRGCLSNLGYALVALERHDEALAAYDQLLALEPDDAVNCVNRGNVLKNLQRVSEAAFAYQQAMLLEPDFAEAHLELAHCRLLAGRYREGWRLFEKRWSTAQLAPHYLASAAPPWLGETALAGRTILLWAEQGLGDTLQFCRCVPAVMALAGHVILRVPATLCALMQSLAPGLTVLDDTQPLPPHDCHAPLMSLPLALGWTTPPRSAPYLTVAPTLPAPVPPGTRRRIGLAWAGRQYGHRNPSRDMPLAALLPLAGLAVDVVSLQKEVPPADAAALRAWPHLQPAGAMPDMLATAALINELDLVISVDTAIAHLAAALGKPCWLLLRHASEWRWQLERADTPWYPTLRIFRQSRAGDWTEVVAAVTGAVQVALAH